MNPPLRAELRIGFMPLLDCALLVVAHEVGMARQQGIALKLVRESSWANIRDRVAIGHFDAAQMLGPMVLAENMGLGHFDSPLVAPAGSEIGTILVGNFGTFPGGVPNFTQSFTNAPGGFGAGVADTFVIVPSPAAMLPLLGLAVLRRRR